MTSQGWDAGAEAPALRCPCENKSALTDHKEHFACNADGCSRRFPVVAGIPVLINEETSIFNIADYIAGTADAGGVHYASTAQPKLLRRLYYRFADWLTDSDTNAVYFRPRHAIERLCARKTPSEPRYRILVIGCGARRFAERPECAFVYTDVVLGPTAQYVCDAHDLPFADGTFDMVVAVAVLEHVMDPPRCVAEIHRVLKPEGWVYASTPFLQPVHMSAHDFTRFTHLGHRRLFRFFDEIESGLTHGPGSVLAWSVQYFMLSLSDNRTLRKGLRLVGKLVTRPLKLLDRRLTARRGAVDVAGGVFFAGSKRESPVPDREIIKLYRGIE